MNRDYKEFSRGTIAHIYNRGNGKEKIFFDEQDYKNFLFRVALALGFNQKELESETMLNVPYSRIRIQSENKNSFKIHSFCLMPNHFHFLIEQCGDISISKLISRISASYSKYINNKYNRVGHIFQDCFKAVNIESDPQLMWTSAYIHMNPVKDGIAKQPEQYKWSSYNDYISKRKLLIVHTNFLKSMFGSEKNFQKETLKLGSNENTDVKETL